MLLTVGPATVSENDHHALWNAPLGERALTGSLLPHGGGSHPGACQPTAY